MKSISRDDRFSLFSGTYFLNPLLTAKSAHTPHGFYNIIGFEADVDPEGGPVEDEAGEAAERD